MRITRRIGAAAVAVAAVSSSPNAAVTLRPDASAPMEEKDSAQIWFERALSLDIGDAGAPDAVQAFAAMRRSAGRRGSLDLVCAGGRCRQPARRLQPRPAL